MDSETKRMILELKVRTDNISALTFQIQQLARECSERIDIEARKA
jgi:hypothetical protein